jgi:hypothetical protein
MFGRTSVLVLVDWLIGLLIVRIDTSFLIDFDPSSWEESVEIAGPIPHVELVSEDDHG